MGEERDLQEFAQEVRGIHDRFVEAMEPHRPALWDYCLHLTGSPWDAEDLVQETMLRAFARLSHVWQPIVDSRAYLFRIASNAWIDQVRRGSARSALEVDLPDEFDGDDVPTASPERRRGSAPAKRSRGWSRCCRRASVWRCSSATSSISGITRSGRCSA